MNRYDEFKKYTDTLRTKRTVLKKELNEQTRQLGGVQRHLDVVKSANWVLGEAIKRVQTSFKEIVETLITSSIKSIYKRDITFSLQFEQKGRGLECRPVTMEDGEEFDLDGEIGGGLLDIISFTSKIVFWKIQGTGRPIFFFDEPFRFLGHGSTILFVGQLLRKLSDSLKIQFIIITHESELAEIADRSFNVINSNGISRVVKNVKKTIRHNK
jgi:DNA repair exonuclease SbcCD ATPase subunit